MTYYTAIVSVSQLMTNNGGYVYRKRLVLNCRYHVTGESRGCFVGLCTAGVVGE